MSLKLSVAARRTYDALKDRPGAMPRTSDARDLEVLAQITSRLGQLISEYRLGVYRTPSGIAYVFWTEVSNQISQGAFDDLLPGL
jgi:hypothetical protein